MGRDEEFLKKKFSIVEQCPKCGQLSLTFKEDMIVCTNCGYREGIPSVR